MGALSNFWNTVSPFIGPSLGLFGGGLAVGDAYSKLGSIGDDANVKYDPISGTWSGTAADIGQQAADMSTFKPFGVTSTLGNTRVDEQGNVDVGLSGSQQYLEDTLQNNAATMFGNVMKPTADREAEVYDRIRATQRPEEARQRQALENRLFSQGRSGVSTAGYGGTPEQLALAKAQEEAKNTASLMAITQGQAEQLQQANIGNQFMTQSYLPFLTQLQGLGAGTQIAGLTDLGRRQGAGLFADALMGGLETNLAARLGQANLMGNLGTGLLSGVLTPSANNPLFGL